MYLLHVCCICWIAYLLFIVLLMRHNKLTVCPNPIWLNIYRKCIRLPFAIVFVHFRRCRTTTLSNMLCSLFGKCVRCTGVCVCGWLENICGRKMMMYASMNIFKTIKMHHKSTERVGRLDVRSVDMTYSLDLHGHLDRKSFVRLTIEYSE